MEKCLGSDRYFGFIDGYMGSEIKVNDMNLCIMGSTTLDM